MARYNRIPKEKKVIVIEERRSFGERFYEAIVNQWKVIGVATAVLLVIVAVAILVSQNRQTTAQTEQVKYYEVMKIEDAVARVEALKALLAKDDSGDVAELVKMSLAAYYDGNKEFDKALEYYMQVAGSNSGKPIRYVAINAAGPVFAALGKPLDAAKLFKEASFEEKNPEPYLSRYQAAVFYLLAGDKEEARRVLQDIIGSDYAPAEMKIKAEEKLLWLDISNG